MPMSRLPSLSALRAFEAAARRLSFKEAAGELSVTPGAVSQQIRALETELGIALFNRAPRAVTLTPAGRALMSDVTEGFMRIRDAVDRVRPGPGEQLAICTSGMIMRNWLFPRLHSFTAQHPDLQTNVRAVNSWDDFRLADNEVAIRLVNRSPTNFYSRELHRLMLIPLASPSFIAKHRVESPKDALHLPLLEDGVVHLFKTRSAWDIWFDAAGIEETVPTFAMSFDPLSADYAFDMALAGSGLILGWSIQCFQALSEGRLECPFGPIVELDVSYHLLCKTSQAHLPHIKAFMDWASEEAALLSTLRSLQLGAA